MAFFERLGNTFSTVGKDGYNKAKELKDATKLTMDIKEREGAIQKMYRELGKAYYQAHKADKDPEYDQVRAIRAAYEEIADLQAEKDAVRGIKRCSSCGRTLNNNTNYCPGCGTKVEEEAEIFAGEVVEEEVVEEETFDVDQEEENEIAEDAFESEEE